MKDLISYILKLQNEYCLKTVLIMVTLKFLFFYLPPTSSHHHPLQLENCDSNSRLVVDEDQNGKFRLERVNIKMDITGRHGIQQKNAKDLVKMMIKHIIFNISLSKSTTDAVAFYYTDCCYQASQIREIINSHNDEIFLYIDISSPWI